MFKAKNRGVTIAQYGIIISLVAIAIIPVFFFMGNSINNYFTSFVNLLKGQETYLTSNNTSNNTNNINNNSNTSSNNDTSTDTTTTTTTTTDKNNTTTQLGGTVETPVKSCLNGECTIDYGEFVLSGIPENFEDHLKTTGSSGTTILLANIMTQIAEQVDPENTSLNINQLLKLANYGHDIANAEKKIEDTAQKFIDENKSFATIEFEVPSAFLDGGTTMTFFDMTLDSINSSLSTSNPTDVKIKSIVNLLANEITDLADKVVEASSLSGISITEEDLRKITEPSASTITNLDSAIICATGDGSDTGTKCN